MFKQRICIFLFLAIFNLIHFNSYSQVVDFQEWNSFVGDWAFKPGYLLDTEIAYNQQIQGSNDW